MTKSPSGALSPYYYKGGYFHGIHYGSYFDDEEALLLMMGKEETYILKSPERRRILIDLYETNLSDSLIEKFVEHVKRVSLRIVKLAISCDKKRLRKLHKAIIRGTSLNTAQLYFCTDMEEAKAWLVSFSNSITIY